jgi:DNA-binding NarL/FixJ family response regulator
VTEQRIRILVCDDHPVVRSGLRGMIQSQPDLEVIAEAGEGAEAVALADRLRPDVVLMDLRMPGMDGVTATAAIKARHPDMHVLILTTYDTDADILRALEKGATGFLLKDEREDRLFDAIREAAGGRSPLAPGVASRLVERLRGDADSHVSEREIEILMLVAQGRSNREIARELHISDSTVKAHMLHIFDKLDVADRTAAVTTALRRGIIRLEP